jgi:hypothetical protein
LIPIIPTNGLNVVITSTTINVQKSNKNKERETKAKKEQSNKKKLIKPLSLVLPLTGAKSRNVFSSEIEDSGKSPFEEPNILNNSA